MARLRFKNFTDLAFLQQVDKPRFLVPLLLPHQAYFRRHGLDVASLQNSDDHDRQLLDVLCAPPCRPSCWSPSTCSTIWRMKPDTT